MKHSKLIQRILFLLFTCISFYELSAQLPECNKYYRMLQSPVFQTVDPLTSVATTNNIALPVDAAGLAVNDNFFAASPSPTYYTTVNGIYHYYDGSTWINTGHSTGPSGSVNPGGAGVYIYNIIGGTGAKIYRYDGTGPSTLFLNLGNFQGPYDLMGDADGNVYILRNGAIQALEMYDLNANLVCSYNLVNLPTANAGGGYSIVNGLLYADIGNTYLYIGTFSGNTISFSSVPKTHTFSDFANCPFPPVNLTIDPPINLGCMNLSTQLSATTSISNPIFSWTGPGIVSGANSPNPTVDQPGVYTLTVTAGPGGTGCTGSATKQVTVVQTGGLTLDMTASILTICEGESSDLIVTAAGGSIPYTYTWDNNLPTGNAHTVSPTATTTYTCVVTDVNNCTGTVSKTIVVDTKPIINAGSDINACIGNQITLSGTGAGTGGTYNWNNGVTDGIPFSPNIGSTTYTLTGINASGCQNTDQVVVNMNPLPTIDAGPDHIICSGVSIKLKGNGSPGSLTWDNGIVNGVNFTPTVGTTTYTVTNTDANGCQNSDQVNVVVQPNAVVSFTADPISGEAPLEVTFTNTSGNADLYNWNFGNGNEATVNDLSQQVSSYLENGSYVVTLTGFSGNCSAQFQVTIKVMSPSAYLIPNVFTPNADNSNDFFTINGSNLKAVNVLIVNRWGSAVFESSDIHFKWNGKVNNTGESCADGIYFFKIKIIDVDGKEIDEQGFVHLVRD